MKGSLIVCLVALLATSQAAVTVNQIKGVTDNNLVYSGTIGITGGNNLFFTYYSADGVNDPDDLLSYPLIVFVGK